MHWIPMLHLAISLLALPWLANRHRDPIRLAAWWLLTALCPPASLLIYLLVGQEPRALPCPQPDSDDSFSLDRLIRSGCGAPRREHNRVELLHNGSNAYAALISALQRARRSVSISYYIICDDRIGRTVCDILIRRARAGVQVRIIYDAFGSRCLKAQFLKRLRQSGIDIRPYAPVRFPWFTPSAMRRNHRKMVIVDSRLALLGGINLARYYLDGGEQGAWRDEHLAIEGEAALDLQRLFQADWRRAGGNDFTPDTPAMPPSGRSAVQIGWSGRGGSRKLLFDAFLSVILRAEREIRITSPYFMPPVELLQALRCAASGGVRIRVMIPTVSDSRLLDLVAESYIDDLLAAGVELYRYEEGFLHAKFLIVDDRLAAVGTANMDYRSLELNEEVTAFLYDRQLIQRLTHTFERDLKSCHPASAANWHPQWWRRRTGELLRLGAPLF